MALIDYSVRIQTTSDYHFIVPVRAGNPTHADTYARRFIEETYHESVQNSLVRYRGRALPIWCQKAKRTQEVEARSVNGKAGKSIDKKKRAG